MKNGQSLCKAFPYSEMKNDGKCLSVEKYSSRVFYEFESVFKTMMKTDSIVDILKTIYLNKIVKMTSRTIWNVTIQ